MAGQTHPGSKEVGHSRDREEEAETASLSDERGEGGGEKCLGVWVRCVVWVVGLGW